MYIYIIKNWKTSAVSTTDWMVETQLCKLRGASDIHPSWGRVTHSLQSHNGCFAPFRFRFRVCYFCFFNGVPSLLEGTEPYVAAKPPAPLQRIYTISCDGKNICDTWGCEVQLGLDLTATELSVPKYSERFDWLLMYKRSLYLGSDPHVVQIR